MNRNYRQYFLIAALSFVSIIVWWRLSYPQLVFANFSIDRSHALDAAKDYLRSQGENPERFKTAIVFSLDGETNRYLQKTIGFNGLIRFLKENDYELFYWSIRFFRENDKEEYNILVSSATKEITGFRHTIDDNAPRESIDRQEAKRRVIEFLKERFYFNPELYTAKGDGETILDHRSELGFSWQKKTPWIPWSKDENAGTAKIVIGAKISGNEILTFNKGYLSIPDQFYRYMSKISETGKILSMIVHVLSTILFISSIFYMIVKRNHLAMHMTKKFYMSLMAISFSLSIFSVFNNWESILSGYSTTGPFQTYFGQLAIQTLIGAVFLSVMIFMPSLAGEALHYQLFPTKPQGAFLYYVRSSFFSRKTTQVVLLGYAVCIMMLGIQSVMFYIGQRYWGVWVEHGWMTNISTAYWPFVAALGIGFQASFAEELMFRLFSISFLKKVFKSTLFSVIVSSLIWGFGHSNYPVFPMWFRGVEVSCLGIFLSYIYLSYGIIPTIVGHYLFDVFWHCAEYLFSTTTPLYLISSLAVLLLPLAIAIIAYLVNNKIELKPLQWHLNNHQRYNLEVLKTFLRQHPEQLRDKTPSKLVDEIVARGWDTAVVEAALEDVGIPIKRL